jgi:hypothetical protein
MQGKISLDWGGIFDILSIYNVKINLCTGFKKEQNYQNFSLLELEIKEQIGVLKFKEIMASKEYQELYDANLQTFKKVEEAQQSDGLAKEVDTANFLRFTKKIDLQKKFFGGEVRETKVGY